MIFVDGTSDIQSNDVVEYIPLSQNLVDTRVDNLSIVNDGTVRDVSFDITTKIVPTTLDAVKQALQQQDLLQYFNTEVLNERSTLQKLISYSVIRVDLTTGDRENFGVLPSSKFSDFELGPVNSVSSLQEGHSYRYKISTLLREPETMFSSYTKSVTDTTSGRTYSFLPSKYMHPVALTEGNITSPKTLATRHAKSSFGFGNTGSVTITEITFSIGKPRVINVSANVVNDAIVEVYWKVEGDVSSIDHFLIVKSSAAGREVIGKSHTQQPVPEFYYFHQLDRHDIGEISYIIIPVMMDYVKGSETSSNKVLINTPESAFDPKTTSAIRDSRQQ